MKKKKVIALILTLVLCISLSACGGTEEKCKGTLENPYQIGEDVVIEDVYQDSYFDDPWGNIPFTLTLKVNDVMTKEEIEADYKTSEYATSRIVEYTFKVDGDYSNAIPAGSSSGLYTDVIMTDSMVEIDSNYVDIDVQTESSIWDIYAGVEYNVWKSVDSRKVINSNAKYYVVKYFDKNGNEQSIYVDLTMATKESTQDSATTNASAEEPEKSEEASTYEIAVAAKEARYYGYALRLFKSIPTYKDAEQQIEELQGVLDEYNAEYTVTAFGGGTYSMKIKDGIATLAFDIDNPSIHYFELFEYVYEDGSTKIHMGNVHDYDGDGVMDDNGYITDGGDIYTLTPTNNGGVMVMAFEGNTNTYWNGSTN